MKNNIIIILMIFSGILTAQSNGLKDLYKASDSKTRSISPENGEYKREGHNSPLSCILRKSLLFFCLWGERLNVPCMAVLVCGG